MGGEDGVGSPCIHQEGDGLTRYLERDPGLGEGNRSRRARAASVIRQPEQFQYWKGLGLRPPALRCRGLSQGRAVRLPVTWLPALRAGLGWWSGLGTGIGPVAFLTAFEAGARGCAESPF